MVRGPERGNDEDLGEVGLDWEFDREVGRMEETVIRLVGVDGTDTAPRWSTGMKSELFLNRDAVRCKGELPV